MFHFSNYIKRVRKVEHDNKNMWRPGSHICVLAAGDQLYQLYKRGRESGTPTTNMDNPRQWATAILI